MVDGDGSSLVTGLLIAADLAETAVVPENDDERQIGLDGKGKLLEGELESPVAGENDDGPLPVGGPGAEGGRKGPAQGAEADGMEEASPPVQGKFAQGQIGRRRHVGEKNPFLRQDPPEGGEKVADLVEKGAEAGNGRQRGPGLDEEALDRLSPLFKGDILLAEGAEERLDDGLAVGGEGNVRPR